jgi:hypothetical protein
MNIERLVRNLKREPAFWVEHRGDTTYLSALRWVVAAPRETLAPALASWPHLQDQNGASTEGGSPRDLKGQFDLHVADAGHQAKAWPLLHINPDQSRSRMFSTPFGWLFVSERELAPFTEDLEEALLYGSLPDHPLVIVLPDGAGTVVLLPCGENMEDLWRGKKLGEMFAEFVGGLIWAGSR